ncbi:sushi, von Willebrand factor type A, EGF and pentraxin domain-containing protein 1-like [Oratosquilla oratoria]|uniref:sushi, von Willebrand factor type A, EGF and pentraxin domain-containing protein 1-like n=1 Tax=Oratosquilla oratoria TaxID=337810 RepID=UPI003F777D16
MSLEMAQRKTLHILALQVFLLALNDQSDGIFLFGPCDFEVGDDLCGLTGEHDFEVLHGHPPDWSYGGMDTGYKGDGYILIRSYNRKNAIHTPSLRVSADHPVVEFAYYLNGAGDYFSYLKLGVQVNDGDFKQIWAAPTMDRQWHYVSVNLPVYAGDNIQVVWKGKAAKDPWSQLHAFVAMDYISVFDNTTNANGCFRPSRVPFAKPWECASSQGTDRSSSHREYPEGTVCRSACEEGFATQGNPEIRCKEGIWHDTDQDITFMCFDEQSPQFKDCPADVELVTPYGWGSMMYTVGIPPISDNTGYYTAQFFLNGELQEGLTVTKELFPGVYHVKFVASDSTENENICAYDITVDLADKTPPEVVSCPSSQSHSSEGPVVVTWEEPEFLDDSGYIAKVEKTHESGQMFLWGHHTVKYTATDNSSNSVSCSFTIVVKGVPCSPLEVPDNGALACTESYRGGICLAMCGGGYDFNISPGLQVPKDYLCSTGGTWYPYSMTFDCTVPRGDNLLTTAGYYFDAPCNDTSTQEQLRQQAFGIYETLDVDITTGEALSPEDFYVMCGHPRVR